MDMIWHTSPALIKTQAPPEHPYFRQAYDFIISWLSGQETFLLQTSGSTGTPKTIRVNRAQLSSSARMTGAVLELPAGTRALVCLNITYIGGIMMLVRGMELDWELSIIEPASNPLSAFEDPAFDFAAMVPLQLSTILSDESTRGKIGRVGKILLGGAPVGMHLRKQIGQLPVPVYQSYGMTETVSHIALRQLNGPDAGKDYRVLPGITFGLDERSCLFISGPVTNGEKIQTNDLAEITSAFSFNWLGRIDNVINSGGVKVALDKVDEVVAEVFYDLRIENDYFSWFENDEKLGQKLILIVEKMDEDGLPQMWLEEIRKRISIYETPKHVYFVGKFKKTPTDKVDKRQTAALIFG
jgi:O-succinylbenzoic acid--CoA ligase